jgi:hypothetical protein
MLRMKRTYHLASHHLSGIDRYDTTARAIELHRYRSDVLRLRERQPPDALPRSGAEGDGFRRYRHIGDTGRSLHYDEKT